MCHGSRRSLVTHLAPLALVAEAEDTQESLRCTVTYPRNTCNKCGGGRRTRCKWVLCGRAGGGRRPMMPHGTQLGGWKAPGNTQWCFESAPGGTIRGSANEAIPKGKVLSSQ